MPQKIEKCEYGKILQRSNLDNQLTLHMGILTTVHDLNSFWILLTTRVSSQASKSLSYLESSNFQKVSSYAVPKSASF